MHTIRVQAIDANSAGDGRVSPQNRTACIKADNGPDRAKQKYNPKGEEGTYGERDDLHFV